MKILWQDYTLNISLFGVGPTNLILCVALYAVPVVRRHRQKKNLIVKLKTDRQRMHHYNYSKRGSRQSRAILFIPELRDDLTEEALFGVCHVRFTPWSDETLQTWLLTRHEGMK